MLEEFHPCHSLNGSLTSSSWGGGQPPVRCDIAEAITAQLRCPSAGQQIWWLDSGNERPAARYFRQQPGAGAAALSPLGYCGGPAAAPPARTQPDPAPEGQKVIDLAAPT
ncbi:MAG: hypothetical protein U0401_20230 [Anaerolineae bacterium]